MEVINIHKYTTPVLKKNQAEENKTVQPLPKPSGNYPYHLSLNKVIPELNSDKLVFHMVGDTGSVRNPDFQKQVACAMAKQYTKNNNDNQPQFLYHLGDVVYHFGEAECYPRQFLIPYQQYPGPIFAIAGNHDSDVNPAATVPYQSLDAFSAAFCADDFTYQQAFGEHARKYNVAQPNVYWRLNTSLANIIGLHSNIPKYGYIDAEQRSWFINELKTAYQERPNKALIVCVHHAPYSADVNHSSSLYMIDFLEKAFEDAGAKPDIVFSGHVHNYQRFNKYYADGTNVPFVVCGSGGFDEMHALATCDNVNYTSDNALLEGVYLESYYENKYGFLKISIEKQSYNLTLTSEYYTLQNNNRLNNEEYDTVLSDRFQLAII